MMNRIEKRFRMLRRQSKKALIAFITAGDPNLSTTERLALEFARVGVDILELGLPFSDPLADGPTIQASAQRALKKRVNLRAVFHLVKKLRKKTELPVVLLTYYNPVFNFGPADFIRQAKKNGVDGAVIPDLPVEEAGDLIAVARRNEFATIFLAAPTSDIRRLKRIAFCSTGFIYYVSLTGTTGARESLPKEMFSQVCRIKRLTAKPVCVGFGVSNPQQAQNVARVADGVIVGSAIVQVIENNLGRKQLVAQAVKFVQKLREAI